MLSLYSRRAVAVAALLVPAVAFPQQGERPARGNQPGQNRSAQPSQNAPAGRNNQTPPTAPAGGDANFKSFEEKLSYVLGVNTARRMKLDNVDPDPQAFSRGFVDALTKEEVLLSDEQMTEVLNQFRTQLQEKATTARQQLTKGWETAFSKDPAGDPKTTKSGLKYEVIEQGEGKKPSKEDVVVVHYVGKLKDGKVFDSSVARGEPAVFPLDQVIKGWTEGLQLMPVGSKYRFQIPAALGYGEKGFPPAIPANADLTFEVELLDVMPQQGGAGEAPEAPEGNPTE